MGSQAMSAIASSSSLEYPESDDPEASGEQTDPDKKKKKSKVRSAWISFIGRIVAQLFGAVATVMLGLQVVRGYLPPAPAGDPAAADETAAVVGQPRPDGVTVLAVLPVANYSGDPRQDAFSDGLTEALIAELAQVPGLQVTSRTSSMHFREKHGLLPAIARQLGVDLVLEGSVVRGGGRIRITAQLIDAASDLHIWARTYEPQERDVLALHSAVAKAVARDVRASDIGLRPNRVSRGPARP